MDKKSANDIHQASPYPFAIRFFTEMKALGVTEVAVSPGSRNTPLVLAADATGLNVKVFLDERVAGFYALGHAKVAKSPVILVCTSGTALANYLPAVIEANHSGVPMIVCSADRPPELRQWGAGQTIDQVQIYGTNVRWFYDLPVANNTDPSQAQNIALRAWDRSVSGRGPVHLNWPFREPLEPMSDLEVPKANLKPFDAANFSDKGAQRLMELGKKYENGLISVGPNDLDDDAIEQICRFSEIVHWPIISDPGSQIRGRAISETVITSGEILCGSVPFTESLGSTEVVVQIGLAPTSKAYKRWLRENPPEHHVLISPIVDWVDPSNSITEIYQGDLFFPHSESTKTLRTHSAWLEQWKKGNAIAASAVQQHLQDDRNELSIVNAVIEGADDEVYVMFSNSMIIRDAELALQNNGTNYRTLCNRGANGIDGIISTTLGASFGSEGKVICLIGDVATTHDFGGILASMRLKADMTIVIFDNGGGGIFSFLPISNAIDKEHFDKYFLTSPKLPFTDIFESLGIDVSTPDTIKELKAEMKKTISKSGLSVIYYKSDTDATLRAFRSIRDTFDQEISRKA
ncbi:MAG: 2-succinyl-5-enolpyruvyl-6-hydroxy-3-cyclohexene-1-carboxylic-acid synthase [Acidimicrobiaceae bacterium]|nr:2-succinyl-5-enolpyruvyl-6-hydroxy-3-cyclohexene-1-carboxylic-acid synthase [Acidimicrobiaceae bacterium]